MPANVIEEAVVRISPDFTGFKQKARAELRAQAADLTAKARIDVDGAGLKQQLRAAVKEAATDLNATIRVTVNKAGLHTQLREAVRDAAFDLKATTGVEINSAGLRARLREVLATASEGLSVRIPVRIDQVAFDLQYASLVKKLNQLRGTADVDINERTNSRGVPTPALPAAAAAAASSGGGIGLSGVLLPAAIVGAISLIPAAAGAATAAVTGLAGAAGVAFLAFKGLSSEWATASGAGGQIRQTILGIKEELKGLEATAAKGAGYGISQAVAELRAALPGLTPLIAQVSTSLGVATDYLSQGLVNGLHAASPLIIQFAQYIENGAKALAQFTASDRFKAFLAYAQQQLPIVGTFLKNLVLDFGSLARGLAPLGSALIAVINGLKPIFDLIGRNGNIFSGLVTGAAVFVVSLKLLGGVGSLAEKAFTVLTATVAESTVSFYANAAALALVQVNMREMAAAAVLARVESLKAAVAGGALSATDAELVAAEAELTVATTALADAQAKLALANEASAASSAAAEGGLIGSIAAMGPLGIAVGVVAGALTIGAVAWEHFHNSSTSSIKSVKDFSQAIEEDTGKIGAHTRALAADQLEQAGLLKKAQDIGLDLQKYVGASIGNPADTKYVDDYIAKYKELQGVQRDTATTGANLPLAGGSGSFVGNQQVNAGDPVYAKRISEANDLGNAIGVVNGKVQDSLTADQRKKAATGELIDATKGLGSATNKLRADYDEALSGVNAFVAGTDHLSGSLSSLSAATEATDKMFQPVTDGYQQWQQSIIQLTAAQTNYNNVFSTDKAGSTIRAEADSRHALADAVHNLDETRISGARSVRQAELSVADAQIAAAAAQRNLIQARIDAVRQVEDAKRSLRDLPNNEEAARLTLEKAQLDEAARTGSQTPEQIFQKYYEIQKRERQLTLSQDKNQLADTLQNNERTRADATKTIKLGVTGNQNLIDAQRQVVTADRNEIQSKKDLAKAKKDAAYSEQQGLYAVQQAQQSLTDTIAAGKQTRIDATNQLNAANLAQETSHRDYDITIGKMKLTEAQAKSLIDRLHGLDKTFVANFDVDQAKAKAAQYSIANIQQQIDIVRLMTNGLDPAAAIAQAKLDFPANSQQSTAKAADAAAAKRDRLGTHPATGGIQRAFGGPVFGPGTERSDSIPAMLSTGEHVWTAEEVRKAGGHGAMEQMRKYVKGFAAGGPVEFNGPKIDLSNMNIVKNLNKTLMPYLTGAVPLGAATGLDALMGGGAGGWNNLAATKKWLMSNADPLPYVFGAVGPLAYDCSGLVGEVWARLTGHPSYKRYFTTLNEGNFFQPGPGRFTVGFSDEHTMGVLDGLPFEAANPTDGIRVGSGTSNVNSFPHIMHLPEQLPSNLGGGTPGAGNVGKGGHLTSDQAKAAGRKMIPAGWNFSALDNVFTRESGWRWNAFNPAGPAYGIPQSLPGSKMASAGADWHDNALTQIKWGIDYIAGRYGTPDRAVAHENAFNWYDQGGLLPPGPSLVMNKTRKPEAILNPEQWDAITTLAQRGAGGGSTMQHVEHQHVYSPSDADLIARKLEFAFRSGGN